MNIPVAPDSFNAYTSGNHFTPVGITLKRVEAIEYNQEFSKYRDTDFVLMCDVNNPLP